MLVALHDVDRVGTRHVGERALGRADGEGSDPAGVVDRQRAVARREPGRKLLAVELQEVDRPIVHQRVNHAKNCTHGGRSAPRERVSLQVDGAVVGYLEHFERSAQTDEHGAAKREIEDLVVGELRAAGA